MDIKQKTNNYRKRKIKEKAFEWAGRLSIIVALLFLVFLIGSLLVASFDILKPSNFMNFVFFGDYTMAPSQVKSASIGIFVPLIGSILIMLVVLIFAVPIGVIAGTYIEEYMDRKSKLYAIISLVTINLAGVPSVIYGILGATMFMALNLRGTFVAAGVTLALLSLPVIIITTQEALRTVPNSLKEAAYGLGMTKWQVLQCVTIPYAESTILTGVILALSRALGEAAPLIMVGVVVETNKIPTSFTDKVTALPLVIDYFYSSPGSGFSLAAATSVILIVLLLMMNSVAIYFRAKGNKLK